MRSVYRRHDARLGSERSSDQNIKSSGSEAQREHSRYRRSRIERLGSLRSVWRASICSSHHGQRFRAPVLLTPQQGARGQAQASGTYHPRRVAADRLTGPRRQFSRPPPSFQPRWWPVCLPGSYLIEIVAEHLGAGRVAQLTHRLGLDLADPFPSHAIHLADLVERLGLTISQPEAH